jgi:fimbrial chaperone protein
MYPSSPTPRGGRRTTRPQSLFSSERASRCAAAAAITVAAVLSSVTPAFASSFTVNPTQIFLAPRTTSALLTLRNESDETLRFQLAAFAWDQSAQGEIQLQPTQDIVFFPALLTLAPKESRNVRVGTATGFDTVEKTYRIFIEELPSQVGHDSQSSVRVLTKMGVPIFMQPAKKQAQASLRDLAVQDGVFHFSLRNTGNVHFVPQTLRVRGTNRAGETVVDKQLDGWYILAGGLRTYELRLPSPECSGVTALSVDVQIGRSALKERLETPPSACVP